MSGQETSPVPPQDSGPTLHVVRRSGTEIVELAGRKSLKIGRSSEADITVDEPTVSRFHIELRLEPEPVVTDLGSSNGTVVGGVRMPPRDSRPLRLDETIEIGTVFLILRGGPARNRARLRRSEVRQILGRAAKSKLPVLLLGPEGSGRKTFARQTARSAGLRQLKTVECALVADVTLPESDALLLSDVDKTPSDIQPLLAAALGNYGGRIFATASAGLPQKGLEDGFDLTLFRAVSGIRVMVPSLADDSQAIAPLAREMLKAAALNLGRAEVGLSSSAEAALVRHPFTGEVSELRAIIERAVLMCEGSEIGPDELLLEQPVSSAKGSGDPDSEEKQRILSALAQTAGNQTRAAELLGFSRRTLTNKLNKYGIKRPRKKP